MLNNLTSLHTVTRWPVLQKVRGRSYKELPLLVDIWFQVLFHSPPGVLFTFPSRYCALSVTREYLALGGGPPCFPQGFTCLVVLWITAAGLLVSSTGLSPSAAGLSRPLRLQFLHRVMPVLNPAEVALCGLGSFPFARRYSENRFFFLFLGVLRCFSSPGLPPYSYVFTVQYLRFTTGGFPHSDISGSKPICGSPKLFAAYRVLHRLLVPRHSPYALTNLTIKVN